MAHVENWIEMLWDSFDNWRRAMLPSDKNSDHNKFNVLLRRISIGVNHASWMVPRQKSDSSECTPVHSFQVFRLRLEGAKYYKKYVENIGGKIALYFPICAFFL